MVRIVVKSAKGPKEIKPQKHPVLACMCGLSKHSPLCDSSHLRTLDEKDDELYVYDPVTGERSVEKDEEMCCGGGGETGCCGGCSDGKKSEQKN